MALLEARQVTVRYGGLAANADVDLEVHQGRLVGLIGPNGAGKTTFIDAVTGYTPLASGTIHFDGHDLDGLSPDARAHRGLVRTFQSIELFDDLTVRDNLLAAAERPRWNSLFADMFTPGRTSRGLLSQVGQVIDTLGIAELADQLPQALSQGQRKLVGIARALAARPKLLLLDEPAAGLDTTESQALGAHLRRLVEAGTTVFLIDHDMGLVLNVCDEIYVLDFGRLIAHGTPAEIRADPQVIAAYLGESAGEAQARAGQTLGAVSAPRAEEESEADDG